MVLAGDYNIVPEPRDIYPTRSYDDNALVQPQSRAAFQRLLDQGWVDAHPQDASATTPSTRSGTTGGTAGRATPACGSTICCSARKLARRLTGAGVDREVRGLDDASDHAPVWIELKD